MATAEARAHQPGIRAGLEDLALEQIEALFHQEEGFLDSEVSQLATWADLGQHTGRQLLTGAVKSILRSEERADAEEPAIALEEISGEASIANANLKWLLRKPKDETLIIDPVPALIINGLTGTQAAYDKYGVELASMGKPSIVFRPARSKGFRHNYNPLNYRPPGKLASQGVYSIMKDVRQKEDYDVLDLIGHSLGGPTSVDAATHRPSWVRNVVHNEATGVDKHDVLEMLFRLVDVGKNEMGPSVPQMIVVNGLQLAVQTGHYVGRAPVRTGIEAIYAGHTNARPRMEKLREDAPHIGFAAIHGAASRFFPLRKVEEDSAGLYDIFHVLADKKAHHFYIQLHARAMAEATMQVIDDLQQLKARRGANVNSPDMAYVAA